MNSIKIIIVMLGIALLPGCVSGSLKDLTAAQLNALQGMAVCDEFTSIYGNTISRMVSVESVRKGATRTEEITMGDRCAITIKTNTGVAPVTLPAGQGPAPAAQQAIIITPSAPTITVAPVVPVAKP